MVRSLGRGHVERAGDYSFVLEGGEPVARGWNKELWVARDKSAGAYGIKRRRLDRAKNADDLRRKESHTLDALRAELETLSERLPRRPWFQTVYGGCLAGPDPFVVVGLVDGAPLREWYRGEADKVAARETVVRGMSLILGSLDLAGLVHCDFTADQFIVRPDGLVTLVDVDSVQPSGFLRDTDCALSCAEDAPGDREDCFDAIIRDHPAAVAHFPGARCGNDGACPGWTSRDTAVAANVIVADLEAMED